MKLIKEGHLMPFCPPLWFDQLDSTSSHLKQMVTDNPMLPSGTVIAAHCQTAGQGRMGRSWLTDAGQNLTFSALVRTPMHPERLPSLPLVVGVAISNALAHYNIDGQLKWPNDILINYKKICGVLLNQVPSQDSRSANCIIGIGINVNMDANGASQIDQPTTSISIETNQAYPVQSVLKHVLIHLDKQIELWENKGFAAIKPTWLKQATYLNTKVTIRKSSTESTTGIHRGIGPLGEILLQDNQGNVKGHFCGDLIL